MIAVTYRIHLNEPAIFSTLDGDPNSTISYPYIPGSAIRGMIIGLTLRQERQQVPTFELDAAAGAYQQLFFSPRTCYLNAYPEIAGTRSLPVPATWAQPKYHPGDHINDSALLPKPHSGTGVKPKPLSGFAQISGNTAQIYKPKMVINVHTARARRAASEQQVFRYEALAAGQTFMGAILCDDAQDADWLRDMLAYYSEIVLGGSRSAGYGSATISNVQQVPDWMEFSLPARLSSEIILTCVSDILLRDEQGTYKPTPAVLEAHLTHMGVECHVEALSLRTTWVGGFNRKWGLPLPQTIAIERGSVFRLIGDQTPDRAALQALLAEGIGERREEGFGRVVLGWQREPELRGMKYEPALVEPKLSEESKQLWKGVRQRIRERQLEERIAGLLYDKPYSIYGNISRTQLAQLRSVIANELRKSQPQRSVLVSYVANRSGKAGGRQLDHARIGGQPLSEWLKNPTFEGFSDNITKQDYYTLRLVDMVLERAYREREGK